MPKFLRMECAIRCWCMSFIYAFTNIRESSYTNISRMSHGRAKRIVRIKFVPSSNDSRSMSDEVKNLK